MRGREPIDRRRARDGWIIRRLEDAVVSAAGLALALLLILPFA
ncbi:hypothetical protein [Methylobacterium symbioticum]|jgi:hypothetical protein|uniref:Uncharacterized protein n=1 Tax=Methylobacterium symbioticum TaxID=2584084 RepID=A0A509EGH3_9HYPH|nr:hypothetical protein [Methylobacterium symbioticum]VUD73261.1 hypothetical protein MET9862_03876 [Methylobacterium symbioticum]